MVTESGTSGETLIDHKGHPAAESPTRRKRWVRLGRSQEKFPRWVRILLWLGVPVVLWAGIYLIGLALL